MNAEWTADTLNSFADLASETIGPDHSYFPVVIVDHAVYVWEDMRRAM
jgi:hypothetical protein